MTAERWAATDRLAELCRLAGRTVPGVARTKAGRRKLQLVGVGCCRAFGHLFTGERLPAAVELAERYADGWAGKAEAVAAAQRATRWAWLWPRADRRVALAARAVLASTIWTAARAGEFLLDPCLDDRRGCSAAEARLRFAGVFRDVFGNPFAPPTVDPRWRTTTAVDLARGIDADRAFDRLPILADAIEDAGCDSPEVLGHCRTEGLHVRGCWVVDLVLS